ncbi:copper oxidase [Methyloprofundus sedimenti]|uniref:Copper oxidase n=1 Tax=Methyloprofundus sedimenti TaxID=1420851 RepID=A0A1V8M6P3_9GAMM|nr:multicopper oxidase domain-containing protein [Methyloprofundus sedimenti]OQK17217.1 copper oxidase [Methyloprofundus sedimenti]
MHNKIFYYRLIPVVVALIVLSAWLRPAFFQRAAGIDLPAGQQPQLSQPLKVYKACEDEHPEWRAAQVIDGVEIDESLLCEPDNPYNIAAFVKGMNNASMPTIMHSRIAEDALTKSDDLDGDGDPDIIRIKLEVIELNGATPDSPGVFPTYEIAPGIQPGMWAFSPKLRGMSVKNFRSNQANAILRAPSPVIRVEQGDKVYITLENTHYFPHTLHFHGVDHAFKTPTGGDNDGVPVTGEKPVMPGSTRTYELQPRHAGTMLYHCHVQTDKHLMMGLNGMFVVEENKPNNWVQTFNVGAGHVRHSSVAIKQKFDREYDLHYQSIDKNLAKSIQESNDIRVISKQMHRVYNMSESRENYFMLNGHSFPFTLRDALIIAKPDENIKLRIANTQHSNIAVHIHGHKATITDYDGVAQNPAAQITRDVYDLAAAQRIDLNLQTTNDGLHSYGEGVWLFHDHVEMGVANDGMSPGGNIALLVYESLLNKQGMPSVLRDDALDDVLTNSYYAKQRPLWGKLEAGELAPDYLRIILFGLLAGLAIGLTVFIIRGLNRADS